jgi:hypothetical protein
MDSTAKTKRTDTGAARRVRGEAGAPLAKAVTRVGSRAANGGSLGTS